MIRPLLILLAFTVSADAADDDRKAPLPGRQESACTYIEIKDLGMRVLIERKVLRALDIRNGATIPADRAQKIIDTNRAYAEGRLR